MALGSVSSSPASSSHTDDSVNIPNPRSLALAMRPAIRGLSAQRDNTGQRYVFIANTNKWIASIPDLVRNFDLLMVVLDMVPHKVPTTHYLAAAFQWMTHLLAGLSHCS